MRGHSWRFGCARFTLCQDVTQTGKPTRALKGQADCLLQRVNIIHVNIGECDIDPLVLSGSDEKLSVISPHLSLVPVTPDRIVPKQLVFRQYHLIVSEDGVSKEQVLPSDFPDEVPEPASECERV